MAENTLRHTAAEEAEMRSAIDESLAEMRQIRGAIEQVRQGIGEAEERTSRLAAETNAVLARIEETIHAKTTL